uniref:SNX24 n=1 Tax=Globodera pallida TaxID=36090 RepID=A0A183BT92_GLOPA
MYEAHLGVVYLMRKNWKCAEIREEIKHEKKECEKLRKYLDILHEYLFRVHLEAAADQTLSQQLPAVKPHFEFYLGSEELPLKTLTQIVKGLIKILPFFFDQYTNSIVVHLMNKYWNCDNIVKKPELNQKEMIEDEKKECQKFRKYLDILYEYLFRVHLEAADQTLSQQLPAVKPQFEPLMRMPFMRY